MRQKSTTRAPTEVANLTRLDYAAPRRDAAPVPGYSLDVTIVNPIQVDPDMQPSYARELLSQLKRAPKLRRGECSQIFIDLPIKIVMDAMTLERLTAKLSEMLED